MVSKRDLEKDDKLRAEEKDHFGKGRVERDLKISEKNEAIKRLGPDWTAIHLAGDIDEIFKLRQTISRLKAEKNNISWEWQTKSDQLSRDRTLLQKSYVSEMVSRCDGLIRVCLRKFDYSVSVEKNFNPITDKKEFRVMHNRDSVLGMVNKLIEVRKKILRPDLTLREKITALEEAESQIPDNFEMSKVTGDQGFMDDLRGFREMMTHEFDKQDEWVIMGGPNIAPRGDLWGLTDALRYYWEGKK
jgi:hypothetical protein